MEIGDTLPSVLIRRASQRRRSGEETDVGAAQSLRCAVIYGWQRAATVGVLRARASDTWSGRAGPRALPRATVLVRMITPSSNAHPAPALHRAVLLPGRADCRLASVTVTPPQDGLLCARPAAASHWLAGGNVRAWRGRPSSSESRRRCEAAGLTKWLWMSQ